MAEQERFKIRAPLRCDGIGRLDCAEDSESGNRLAVRWLPLEANGKAAVHACQQLPTHPGLPRIRRTGEVGASAYLALDFPEGKLLAAMLGEALSPATLINVVAQLADALATIHAQGVVHGEISADSVLLVLPEKAYLWDMPLVIANRLTDRRGEERLMTQLVKTAPFLSPERARGELASEKSDVYAVGAIAAVAAGAEVPSAPTILGLVHLVASGQWQPRIPRTFPEPMRSMLERMVAVDPSRRPSAREVADLFMPTAVSMPTLREMAAVQLPPELLASLEARAKQASSLLLPTPAALPSEMGGPAALPFTLSSADVSHFSFPQPRAAAVSVSLPEIRVTEVALADNVSVSSELAEAGAVSYSAVQLRAFARKRLVKVGGAVVAAVLSMVVLGMALRSSTPVEAPRATLPHAILRPMAAAPVVVEPVAPAVEAQASDDDLLSPLQAASKHQARTARKSAVVAPAAAAGETAEAAPSTKASDFGFLEANADSELKRPEL